MSPTFNFTSGNPSNLVAGQTANMADIQGSLTDLRAGINGNLDEVNVPNLTAAFTAYRPPQKFVGQITTGGVGTTFLLSTAGSIQNVVPNTASADPSPTFFYLDPADFTANARTTKLRLRPHRTAAAAAPHQHPAQRLGLLTARGLHEFVVNESRPRQRLGVLPDPPLDPHVQRVAPSSTNSAS
jgi:hypothetical protein